MPLERSTAGVLVFSVTINLWRGINMSDPCASRVPVSQDPLRDPGAIYANFFCVSL